MMNPTASLSYMKEQSSAFSHQSVVGRLESFDIVIRNAIKYIEENLGTKRALIKEAVTLLTSSITKFVNDTELVSGVAVDLVRLDSPESEQHIDRSKPTIVIFTEHFSEKEIPLILASSISENKSVNLLILPSPVSSDVQLSAYSDNYGKLKLQQALVVERFSHIYQLDLEEPLEVDAILSISNRSLIDLRGWFDLHQVLILNSSESERICHDKSKTREVLAKTLVNQPKWVSIDREYDVDLIAETIGTWRPESGVVGKPTTGGQGRGVRLFPKVTPSSLKRYIENLFENEATDISGIIFEQRIPSAPLADDPENKLDWNLRVLFGSEMIDLECRIGKTGKPINKHTGAKIIEFDEIYAKLAQSPEFPSKEQLYERIQEVCTKVADAIQGGFIGLDLIVDPQGEVWVVEVNGADSGGMTSLAEIRSGVKEKLRAPDTFLGQLPDLLEMRQNFRRQEEFDGFESMIEGFDLYRIAAALYSNSRGFLPNNHLDLDLDKLKKTYANVRQLVGAERSSTLASFLIEDFRMGELPVLKSSASELLSILNGEHPGQIVYEDAFHIINRHRSIPTGTVKLLEKALTYSSALSDEQIKRANLLIGSAK